MQFLNTEDGMERMVMQAVAAGARIIQEQRDRNLAVQIANEVGKMFGGGAQ